jgi:heterodisulfide reductase subunit D
MRHEGDLLHDDRLWTCLTCLHCSQVCPAGVAYSDLTQCLRTEAHKLGQSAVCTHGEVIHAWMRMMMDPAIKQDRVGWLNGAQARSEPIGTEGEAESRPGLRTSDSSDTLVFVGCAPYFDVKFRNMGVDGNRIPQAVVRILNALGIVPRVLTDERCCGHDLLWEGDECGFRRLAELNANLIRESSVKRIITACPECARALAIDYPDHGFDLDVEVLHLAQFLARYSEDTAALPGLGRTAAGVPKGNAPPRATYHDPCRLGRHLGVYDAPRGVISKLGMELIEMPRHGENALCCGTNGWTHCGAANKQIQADRLREAEATGADILITACLKCQIHFECARQDRELGSELEIEIQDLTTLVAERLDQLDLG